MKPIGIAFSLLLAVAAVSAQGGRGSITGTITDQDGGVHGAKIEARNVASGMIYSATTARGNFTLSQLPPGTYEISVPPLGFRTDRFVQQDVIVQAGQTNRLNIQLVQGNLGVVGDDAAFLAIHNRYAGLTGRAPRTVDGKPDFSGVWQGNVDPNPEKAATLPWVDEVMKERFGNDLKDLPSAACLPDSPFLSTPILYKFVQTPHLLVQLFESEPHYRQVYLDGRPHPKDLDPTWMGHSAGRWEGDTLVIDSVGFNDKTWVGLDLLPHSEILHIVERYRRPDLAHLTMDVTIEDPKTLAKPFVRHMVWELAPGEEILEYICTENNKYLDNIGGK